MKPRILLVCYYFPPLGLAGVTRPLNLFKFLPKHGYECHVLTVKPVAYRKYEPELLEGLDKNWIFRSGSRDPQRIMYLMGIREVNPRTIERGRHISETMFPDSKIGWVAPAIRLGIKLHDQHKYRAIISTSPPISAHLVGMGLAKQTGLPWVADFRDLWSTAPIEQSYTNPAMIHKGHKLLEKFQANAGEITAVNQAIASYVGAGHIITNGFDPDIAAYWRPSNAEDPFLVGLLGSYSESFPVEPLLRVLEIIRAEKPDLGKQVGIIQVGNVDTDWLNRQLDVRRLRDACECYGLQPRVRSIQLLSKTSLLYLGVHRDNPAFTSSRVFDMLASGRPLLVYAAPESELGRLVCQCPNSLCFDEKSINSAVDFVTNLIRQHVQGKLEITPIPAYAEPFSWETLSGAMARVLDGLP